MSEVLEMCRLWAAGAADWVVLGVLAVVLIGTGQLFDLARLAVQSVAWFWGYQQLSPVAPFPSPVTRAGLRGGSVVVDTASGAPLRFPSSDAGRVVEVFETGGVVDLSDNRRIGVARHDDVCVVVEYAGCGHWHTVAVVPGGEFVHLLEWLRGERS